MHEMRPIRCDCCQLEHSIRVEDTYQDPITLCEECLAHRAGNPDILKLRDRSHIAMYSALLAQAHERIVLAEGKIERTKRRMQWVYRSREIALKALDGIAEHHMIRPTGACTCAKKGCRVAKIFDDTNVLKLLREYEVAEKQRLWQDRWDNEDRYADEWDRIIDETAVTPPISTEVDNEQSA
jgi:hypothetical protein